MQEKQKTLINFKKARSLMDTIIRMLEKDRYCVEVMQQNLAAIGLLRSAHEKLLTNHLKTCFTGGMGSKSPAKRAKMVGEIETLMKLYNK